MFSINKINPMARAVGTMGAVAALVGGITFANFTSNTVALGPNNLTTASAALQIGDSGCNSLSSTSFPGITTANFSVTNPASETFCLRNTGGVPLNISGSVSATDPGALNGSPAAQNTTLSVNCGSDPAVSGTLNTSWATTFPTALAASGGQELCTATLTLSPSYGGSGNEAIPTFNINFVGTEPTPST
jgi:hypothetical protein